MNARPAMKPFELPLSQPDRSGAAQAALLLVLGTETVFFATLLVAYVALRISAGAPPYAAAGWQKLALPAANTLVLFASALVAARALRRVRQGDVRGLGAALQVTLALGLIFVAGQAVEFLISGLRPNDPGYGGVYFALIGFHAIHVLAGVFILALNVWRAHLGDFTARNFTPVRTGVWFWYYVTAVWAALFVALFLI